MKKKIMVLSLALALAFVLSASFVMAQTESATGTLNTLGGSMIDQSVAFASFVIVHYWGYILLGLVLSFIAALALRIGHVGVGRR